MNFLCINDLTIEQIRLITMLYTSAIIPLILISYLHWKKYLASWVLPLYICSFFICAFGWEIWFTYGLCEGDPVNLRRSIHLSNAIPMHINWMLNSLADAGTICLGGLFLIWKFLKGKKEKFNHWNWSVFLYLLIIFIGQNIIVEMFLYHDQLADGKILSWAPFSPLGSWINPLLFQSSDRTVFLQTQMPWLIMTPVFYKLLIYYLNKYNVD